MSSWVSCVSMQDMHAGKSELPRDRELTVAKTAGPMGAMLVELGT